MFLLRENQLTHPHGSIWLFPQISFLCGGLPKKEAKPGTGQEKASALMDKVSWLHSGDLRR